MTEKRIAKKKTLERLFGSNEGKTRPIPVRLTAENDAYVSKLKTERKYKNRNLVINIIISEHRAVENYKLKRALKIRAEMEELGIEVRDIV